MARIHSATALLTLAATLAACGDSTTAPDARSSPRAGERDVAWKAATVALTLQIRTPLMDPAYGASGTTVQLTTDDGTSTTVADNSAPDADPRDGFFRVMMPASNAYTATVVTMPPHYATLPATKTVAGFVSPTAAPMGTLLIHRKPVADVRLYLDNKLTPGQTVHVTGPNGYSQSFADGTASDGWFGGFYPNDGLVNFELPTTGIYTACATTSPLPKWSAGCKTLLVGTYDSVSAASLYYAPQLLPH